MIYLDHAATTPLDPRALEAMLPWLREGFGNASSVHAAGRKARFAVEDARERVAARLGVEPGEVVFTSGATEADNAALRGLTGPGRGGLLTSAAEHEAILQPAEALAREGVAVTLLRPDACGGVSAGAVADALAENEPVGLVSLMHVNNEVGTTNPVAEIGAACRAAGVVCHTDAVQGIGLLNPMLDTLGADLASISAHKLYGPKGVGALVVRGGVDWRPLILGGAQERRRRGGTENVAGVVGFAAALDLAYDEGPARRAHARGLQEQLRTGLAAALPAPYRFNTPSDADRSAPHILHLSFPPEDGRPLDGEMLLLNLDMQGICASSGSACTSGAIEPSHVLLAMGQDRPTAAAALRFSVGKDNTEAEIDTVVDRLATILRRMRR